MKLLWKDCECCDTMVKHVNLSPLVIWKAKNEPNDLIVLDKEVSWQNVDVVMKYILKSVSKKAMGIGDGIWSSLETNAYFPKHLKLLTELFYYSGLRLYDF